MTRPYQVTEEQITEILRSWNRTATSHDVYTPLSILTQIVNGQYDAEQLWDSVDEFLRDEQYFEERALWDEPYEEGES